MTKTDRVRQSVEIIDTRPTVSVGSTTGSIHEGRSSAELSTEVALEVAPGTNVLDVSAIPVNTSGWGRRKTSVKRNALQDTLVLLELEVVLTVDVGEAPLAGDDDLLATGELVASAAESFLDDGGVLVLCTDGKDDLADIDTSDGAVRLSPSATHAGLETDGQESKLGKASRKTNKRDGPICSGA